MAGYSKGIVDTRKLNKNNKAKLGRGGDTELREVDNKESHVNAFEAYLIDVNGKAGEEYAKRVGAGTVNPLTGMPEYWDQSEHQGFENITVDGKDYAWSVNANKYFEVDNTSDWYQDNPTVFNEITIEQGDEDPNAPDPYSYEALKDVTGKQLKAFDPELGIEDEKYFQYIFSDKPFDFLEDQQDLTTRGLESAYRSTMGGLRSKEETLGLQSKALGTSAGRGISQAVQGAGQAASRSNMAFSGTVTQGLEAQKKQLFQDYTAGMEGVQIGMGDIRRERGTASDTLALGKDTAALDFARGTYGEEQKQLDEYWQMIGLRQSAG